MTYTLIAHQELTSSQAAITFNSIPTTFTDLCLVFSARTDRSNFSDFLVVRPNGASANGSARRLFGNGSGSFSFTDSVAFAGIATGNTTTANTFGNSSFYIPNYRSNVAKSISSDGVGENNATASGLGITASLWNDTSAITSLVLLSETGSTIIAGSSATLFGITAGTTPGVVVS